MLEPKNAAVNIKPAAQEVLKNHVKADQYVLLSLDDGSNQYSTLGGTCKIGADFQLVVLDQKDPEFDVPVKNNANLHLYTSKNELAFLANGLVLNARNYVLSLHDDTGVIDGSVGINEAKPQKLSKEELAQLGTKQC